MLTTVPILSVSTAESSTPDQFMCLNASTNSYNGIWDMDGGTFTFHDTVGTIPHPIGIQSHQSRLVAQFGSSIIFTAPGVYDIPTGSSPPNFVNFGESEVRWLVAVPPSDLLVGTRSGGVYNVQGDLSDPIVRTLVPPGNALYSRCQAYLSSAGPVVWRSTGPTVINTDGQATPLARNLSYLHFSQNFTDRPDDALGSTPLNGTFGQLEQFLFVRSDGLLINRTAANDSGATTDDPTAINDWVDDNILHLNGPLVFDTETGAWFRATHPDVADLLSPSHNVNIDGILLSICSREFEPEGDEPLAYAFRPSARSWKYTWRSAPLHTKSGRTVDLEEVQIGAYGHVQPIHTLGDDTTLSEPTEGDTASTTSTLVVTATNEAGNTKSTTVTVPPGPHVLTVPLKLRGTYVDVTVTASSAHRIIEAPTIEYIEFGWTEGHVKRQT